MPVKIFKEVFQSEEFQFVNVSGETISVFTKFISTGDQQKFLKTGQEYRDKIKAGENVDPYEMVFQSMVLRFGKDKEFWKQFSDDLLKEVSEFFENEAKKKSETKLS